MLTIFKYKLNIEETTVLQLPICAQILTANHQDDGDIYIWAKVDIEHDLIKRFIGVYPTGGKLPDRYLTYINTVHVGILVFHVFELTGEIKS